MSDNFREQLKRAQAGDQRALAELLTAVENNGPAALGLSEIWAPASTAFRFGITGPPGAGKSTLIAGLLEDFLHQGKKVAVLAIDPSSPFSNGAILGDRIRYNELVQNSNLFVRSLATRGSLGGLSAAAYAMVRVLDAVGFDVIFIETVGVGQIEIDIMHVADKVVLVLVPESGDSVQATKAGILEIADLFVVNKSDRPGADLLKREIENSLLLQEEVGGRPANTAERVHSCSAMSGEGVKAIAKALSVLVNPKVAGENRRRPTRLQHEAFSLLRAQSDRELRMKIASVQSPSDLPSMLARN